jgi:hypothetical protein
MRFGDGDELDIAGGRPAASGGVGDGGMGVSEPISEEDISRNARFLTRALDLLILATAANVHRNFQGVL